MIKAKVSSCGAVEVDLDYYLVIAVEYRNRIV